MTKKMAVPDAGLTIMDDHGHQKKFSVKIPDRSVFYNKKDVQNIVDACLAVMEDCLKRGEDIVMYGIGTFGLKYRAPRMVKAPGSDEWQQIPEHYVPYWKFGNVMQNAARIYEAALRDSKINLPDPVYDDGDLDEDFEDGEENG